MSGRWRPQSGNLGTESILGMHTALLGAHDPRGADRWRDVQVRIGASGLSPAGAPFIPPTPDRVPECMENLARFLARDDLPVLAPGSLGGDLG